MVRFEYLEPKTLKEAASVLAQYGKRAKIIAGGTDLLRQLNERSLRPRYLVTIKHIPQLGKISPPSRGPLTIGAACTIGSIERSAVVQQHTVALFEAAHALGSVQIRNLATIGGNLCNAAPSAETAPILLARQAKVHIFGTTGQRVIAVASFFQSAGKTVLKGGELVTHLSIPAAPPGSGEAYMKHSPRSSMDIAVVNVAAVITLTPNASTVKNCAIALGAVAPTPLRAHKAESMLKGKAPSPALILQVAQQAAREAKPLSDIRGSATYRREMVSVLTARVVTLALERARLSVEKQHRSL